MEISRQVGMKKSNKGISLIELIVVTAIITTLAGLLVPQFVRYITTKRTEACTSNKETILSVYEKCVYGGNLKAKTADFQSLINAAYTGSSTTAPVQYVEEIKSHLGCPSGGTYSVDVDTTSGAPVARIWCDCDNPDHAIMETVDFVGWGDLVKIDDPDSPFDVPTVTPSPTEPATPTPTITITPTPSKEISDSFWPYSDDSRWDTDSSNGRNPGSELYISGVPTGLFAGRTDGGGPKSYYCVVCQDGGTGRYKVLYEKSAGPQLATYKSDSQLIIKWSGTKYDKFNSIEQIRDKDSTAQDPPYFITLGDIYELDNGCRYIYFHIDGGTSGDTIPPQGTTANKWGNWYKMGEDIVE